MTDPAKFIEKTYGELEFYVQSMEDDMLSFADDYLSSFYVDDTTLKSTSGNFELANKSDKIFDDAYKAFILGFLLFLGEKIINGTIMTVADFSSKGIKPVGDEAKLVGKMIGYEDGKIVAGGFLDNVGKMGLLRQKFHDFVIKSVISGQSMNLFLKTARPLFKSSETESAFAGFYRKYAYDLVAQSLNSIALYIADKRNLTHFLYKGSLVRDSRPFCIEHAGHIYTRKDASNFDQQTWKGKIEGVPFLIAVGGYQCGHVISWLPNK